jgi:hypothetical protein
VALTPELVWRAIERTAGRSDAELAAYLQPSIVVPKLVGISTCLF